jgi:hypothetical protein
MAETDQGSEVVTARLCEATTPHGRPCQNPPLKGRPLCVYHGGQVAEPAVRRVTPLMGVSDRLGAWELEALRAAGKCTAYRAAGRLCGRRVAKDLRARGLEVCRAHVAGPGPAF